MDLITSRAIMGMYFQRLEAATGMNWIDRIANSFTSDQSSEEYAFLGMPPAMREWIGGRHAKGFSEDSLVIANKHYEATLHIANKDRRRDKTGQVEARVGEFVDRSLTHYASLLSTAIANGESTVCYDGQFFFDIDHSEGDSGTLSNDITTAIAGLPAQVHGAVTAPSTEEMQQAIQASISQMLTFNDDQGEPINEFAREFLIMIPVGLQTATRNALTAVRAAGPGTVDMDGFNITAAVNPRLTRAGWTDKFVTFRTDSAIKSLIRQEETATTLKVKGDGSDFEFDNDAIELGIDSWRGAGFGRWQGAVLNRLV